MNMSLAYEIDRYLNLCSTIPGIQQTLQKHFLSVEQLKPLYHLLKRVVNCPTVGETHIPSACFAHPSTLDFVLSYYDGHGFRVALFDEQKSAHIVASYLEHYFVHGDTENLMDTDPTA